MFVCMYVCVYMLYNMLQVKADGNADSHVAKAPSAISNRREPKSQYVPLISLFFFRCL